MILRDKRFFLLFKKPVLSSHVSFKLWRSVLPDLRPKNQSRLSPLFLHTENWNQLMIKTCNNRQHWVHQSQWQGEYKNLICSFETAAIWNAYLKFLIAAHVFNWLIFHSMLQNPFNVSDRKKSSYRITIQYYPILSNIIQHYPILSNIKKKSSYRITTIWWLRVLWLKISDMRLRLQTTQNYKLNTRKIVDLSLHRVSPYYHRHCGWPSEINNPKVIPK